MDKWLLTRLYWFAAAQITGWLVMLALGTDPVWLIIGIVLVLAGFKPVMELVTPEAEAGE
jgi:hypothetical protein